MKKELLGVTNYVSTDFVTGKPVETGKIGSLYGVDIYVSTNIPTENTDEKGALLMHKDAIVFAEQLGVRVQTQYKQEYLADLMTADTLYGVETYRPEAGVKDRRRQHKNISHTDRHNRFHTSRTFHYFDYLIN